MKRVFALFALAVLGWPAAAVEPPAPPRFEVTAFALSGELPIDEAAAQRVLAPFRGEHQGLAGLAAAAEALEAALREAGYGLHRVILPPQTLEGGVVRLEVVPFAVDRIDIEGNRHFDRANVLHALPSLEVGTSPNLRRLSRELRLANRHPSRHLRLGFAEGEGARSLRARVQVQDRRPASAFAVVQNSGSEQTGEYRLTLGAQYSNLFDLDHQLTVFYTTAPDERDAVQQVGLSYRLPLYALGGTLTLAASDSDVDAVLLDGETPDLPLFETRGKGRFTTLFYEHELLGTDRYRHAWFTGWADKLFDNRFLFLGEEEPAAGTGKVRSNPFSLGYRGSVLGERAALSFELEAVRNLPRGSHSDEAAYGEGADPEWRAWRYRFDADWRALGRSLLRWRLEGQRSGQLLIEGEKFGLGGLSGVRGYAERMALGDDGWQTSLEWWSPPWRDSVNVLLFYDFGRVENEGAEPVDLAGAGLGLRWRWRDAASLRLDFARAAEPFDDIEAGDTRAHFSFYYRF